MFTPDDYLYIEWVSYDGGLFAKRIMGELRQQGSRLASIFEESHLEFLWQTAVDLVAVAYPDTDVDSDEEDIAMRNVIIYICAQGLLQGYVLGLDGWPK